MANNEEVVLNNYADDSQIKKYINEVLAPKVFHDIPLNVLNTGHFSLVNEYETDNGMTIYHFDFYRIKKLDEVYDMGYEDYFYNGGLCLIEWPELIESLLPEDAVEVHIAEQPDGTRTIEF